jgi:RNA polymerase nonessential primary-like sigma factor
MRAIGRTPLLTPEDEINLARLVQKGQRIQEACDELKLRSGGRLPTTEAWAAEAGMSASGLRRCLRQAEKARAQMVLANLRLVVSMARRYSPRPADLEDLIQEGTIGLIKAVERFDPARGYRFSTYATWWIRDGLSSALALKGRTIRLPSTMVDQLHRLRQAQQRLGQELGRDPSLGELAEATGLKPLDIREVLFRAREPLSLDGSPLHGSDLRLVDTLACQARPPHDLVTDASMRHDIRQLLNQLPDQQATLLRLRYGIKGEPPLSLSAAARAMGLTRDQARGLERRAHASLLALSTPFAAYLEA